MPELELGGIAWQSRPAGVSEGVPVSALDAAGGRPAGDVADPSGAAARVAALAGGAGAANRLAAGTERERRLGVCRISMP